MDIVKALNWRYATKKMNGEIIPGDKLDKIVTSIHLAPSGIGLQPYEIIIISSKDWKQKIFPIAMNQAPVVQCSHLLVFAAWDSYTTERIDRTFDYLNQQRQGPTVISENQRKFAKRYFAGLSEDENFHHAAKQAHIALGLAIAAAALEQIDTTPMEGFDPLALDELLGLKDRGLKSSMLLALGYRDKDQDWSLTLKKVRKPLAEMITVLK